MVLFFLEREKEFDFCIINTVQLEFTTALGWEVYVTV